MKNNLLENQISKVLSERFPKKFVNEFLNDRGHGFIHGEKVLNIALEIIKINKVNISKKELELLKFACIFHDIGDSNYSGGFNINTNDYDEILIGMNKKSIYKVREEINKFGDTLKEAGKIRSFHNLVGALLAYQLLKNKLSQKEIRLVSQAIIFHSERKLEFIPKVKIIQLLRDADKIEGIDAPRLLAVGKRFKRKFFYSNIPIKLRKEILKGRIRPEEQETRDSNLKLDIFQYVGARSLFLDTNPKMYANANLVAKYFEKHEMFNSFLREVIKLINEQNKNLKLKKENLVLLKDLLDEAEKNPIYDDNRKKLEEGKKLVNGLI